MAGDQDHRQVGVPELRLPEQGHPVHAGHPDVADHDAGVEVERHWPEGDVWVRADLVRLEQVLVNRPAMSEAPDPRLTLSIDQDAERVTIGVADNGPGIADENLARIFEPFFTTKSPGSGLGLGLSISSRIIDDLGGRLSADNRPGGGAQFTIILPRDRGAHGTDRTHDQESSSHA